MLVEQAKKCQTEIRTGHIRRPLTRWPRPDSVMVSEALRRDFDKPLLAAAFPGWPVESGFELRMEEIGTFVS